MRRSIESFQSPHQSAPRSGAGRPAFPVVFAALLVTSVPAVAEEYLELVESRVFETKGTAAEITRRAQTCAAAILRNDEVRVSDSAPDAFGNVLGAARTAGVGGGDVIVSVDPEQGALVANSRVDYSTMAGMVALNTRSTVTVLAKDGRFKIQHTNIETLQKSTGYAQNNGYTRQGKWRGSGWQKAEEALQGVSEKIASCVAKPPSQTDW